MSVSDFIYGKLKTIAKTYPNNVPLETKAPYIVYNIDSVENTKAISGIVLASENFTTITVYAGKYDDAQALATQVINALSCSKELNIMGATFTSKSNGYDEQPIDLHNVALEFSIYERY